MKAGRFLLSWAAASLPLVLLCGGCYTRSISNSGYRGGAYAGGLPYQGELSEFDVLGVDRSQAITEADIAGALDHPATVTLRRGGTVLLIQSGAMFPDEPMQTELSRHVNVIPFSGVPPRRWIAPDAPGAGDIKASYFASLRLASARGGCETIVCYWGVLESAQRVLATKPVSWVPVVGWTLPDESQSLRIRLKIAVIDVRSGGWSILTPEPFEDHAVSGRWDRASADQKQVLLLKRLAYEAGVKDLVRLYIR